MKVSEFDRICVSELARSVNTTNYTSGQVIGSPTPNQLFVFANAGRGANATGYIRSIRALTNQATCVAVLTLWLYNDIPAVVPDGGTFQNYWAERNMCLGHFTLPALAQFGNSDYALAEDWFNQSNIYACSSKGGNLYGQLTTGTGFTPNSGQIIRIELGVHQNESTTT